MFLAITTSKDPTLTLTKRFCFYDIYIKTFAFWQNVHPGHNISIDLFGPKEHMDNRAWVLHWKDDGIVDAVVFVALKNTYWAAIYFTSCRCASSHVNSELSLL